jgi:hypothetical protein
MQDKLHSGGRVSSSETKRLLKPIVEAVHAELVSRGHSLVFSQVQELVAAGFGFYKLKLLLESGARLITTRHAGGYSEQYFQYRTASIERRCRDLIPGISDSEVPFVAMRVIDHLCKSKLVIDAQDAFFYPTAKSRTILSSLAADHDPFRPVNASVAIYAGILPKIDLAAFRSIERHRFRRSGALVGDAEIVADGVASKKIRLLTSAPPDRAEFTAPYNDHYEGRDLKLTPIARDSTRASLGSGFCLVMESQFTSRWKYGPGDSVQARFFSSIAEFTARSGWHFHWLGASVRTYLTQTKWRDTGAPRMDFSDCPVVDYCPKCDQLYTVDGPRFFAHTGCSH